MNDEDAATDMVSVHTKPPWLAPVLIGAVILAIYLGSRKKDEVAENVLVDYVVIAVAVAAIWAVFRKLSAVLDAPGLGTFFGAPVQPHPAHPDTVDA